MTNLQLCKDHMNDVADQAMQATNVHATPFMLNLYREIASPPGIGHPRQNVLISPISVIMLLGMISTGAQGATDDEITKVLGWDELNEIAAHSGMSRTIESINSYAEGHNATIVLSNAVFVQNGVKVLKRYRKALANHYAVEKIYTVDFSRPQTRNVINNFIEERTNGLIKESIPPNVLDATTKLVLSNALYFRAAWELPFAEIYTYDNEFYTSKNSSVKVPMMYQTDAFNYGHIGEVGAKVIELKYKALNTSMYVLLPDMDDPNGDPLEAMDKMKKKISSNQDVIPKIDSYLSEKTVSLSLPKFKVNSKYHYLKKLISSQQLLAPPRG